MSESNGTAMNFPTLANTSLLVNLVVHYWNGTRVDHEIGRKVADRYHASGTYIKQLLPAGTLRHLRRLRTRIHVVHAESTLPWLDKGLRIIAAKEYPSYLERMHPLIREYSDRADALVDCWDDHVRDAVERDKSFVAAHYPAGERIRVLYGVDLKAWPVPTTGDFRLRISDEATDLLRDQLERDVAERFDRAMKVVGSRVRKRVEHVVERLRAYDPGGGGVPATGVFRDSLISNVRELADLMAGLNVGDTDGLRELCAALRNLCEVTPAQLRASALQRQDTIRTAELLLSRIDDYTGGAS